MGGQAVHGHRVPGLVNGSGPEIPAGLDMAVLGRTGNDLHEGFVDVLHVDDRPIIPGGHNGRFIQKVAQIRSGKAGGSPGNGAQADGIIQLLILGVDPKDFLPALYIRAVYLNLTVKPAGTQQRGIQNIRTVGGSQDDDALGMAKAIHLHQQLVQGLLLFVVAAAQTRSALAAYGIDLIDEHNGRGQLLGLLKQIPDPAGAHAHIHFHKVGTGDGKELHVGFSGHRPGQQGLAGARRANQQNAMGNPGADLGKFPGIPKKIHNFRQLFLFFIRTGHIGKGDLLTVRHAQHRPGLSEIGKGVAAVHLPHQQGPQHQQNTTGKDDGQHKIIGGKLLPRNKIIAFQLSGGVLFLEGLLQLLPERFRLGQLGPELCFPIIGGMELQGNGISLHNKGANLLLFKQPHQFGIGQLAFAGGRHAADPGKHQNQGSQVDHQRYKSSVIQSSLTPYRLSFIGFRLQNADVGQIAVMLIKVQAIAHHKFVGYGITHIVRLQGDAGLSAFRLIQEGADL